MRKLLKRIASIFLIPLTRWYLREERKYKYGGIEVSVFPGVFHPGLFHSTRFLLSYLKDQELKNKSLLELGCGTGLISIYSAEKGAIVTASDLNKRALDNAQHNCNFNHAKISFFHSDLFDNIPDQIFDWI